ncbi:MAG: enoyl-CoA hydratase/isomerase family protein [Acidobacteriota bacterium]|nr:enoyl-CoA hydratase/isomerase family protein [Acidobacteriota bacterium]
MTEETLICIERREAIALVTFNRTSKQNAMNAEMIAELSRALADLRDETGIRVVILTGKGEAFSCGPDFIPDFKDEETRSQTLEQGKSFAHAVRALTDMIENLGKPVIAAINGPASGYGCELALACAWRIASPEAMFALSGLSSGQLPCLSGAMRLSRIIGRAQALEMILTGESLSAEEALRIGLVNRVVSGQGELLQVCEELARQVSRNAPLAIKYALEAVNHGNDLPLANGLQLESALFGLCFATKDVLEGTRAFLEKRPPIFKGQ